MKKWDYYFYEIGEWTEIDAHLNSINGEPTPQAGKLQFNASAIRFKESNGRSEFLIEKSKVKLVQYRSGILTITSVSGEKAVVHTNEDTSYFFLAPKRARAFLPWYLWDGPFLYNENYNIAKATAMRLKAMGYAIRPHARVMYINVMFYTVVVFLVLVSIDAIVQGFRYRQLAYVLVGVSGVVALLLLFRAIRSADKGN